MMVKVEDLIAYISPTICVPGGQIFTMVILQMKDYLLEHECIDDIRMSVDIYNPVAGRTGKTCQTIAKAIDRVTDRFWMDGQNTNLNRIIGRKLFHKPYPKEFVLYCAHFLAYGEPYHKSTPAIFGAE